jgi:hypothetical protein
VTTTISRPTNLRTKTGELSSGGTNDTQQAMPCTAPKFHAPAGENSRPTRPRATTEMHPSGGSKLAGRQQSGDPRDSLAASDQPVDRRSTDGAQSACAVGSKSVPDPVARERTTPVAISLLDPALALAADVLDDIERVRTANENRLRQLTRSVEDSDGELRGFGLDETHPDVARLAAMVDTLKKVEHDATLQLQRQLRRHPLHPWVKAQKGVGEKQAARLLAAVGDPYINSATGLPRTVSALWAYCGLHVLPVAGLARLDAHAHHAFSGNGGDPCQRHGGAQDDRVGVAPKRQRGQRANWSTRAKTRAYLIAESCLKQLRKPCHAAAFEGRWLAVHYDECACSPYRVVYDRRRMHTAGTRPDWTDGHSHTDAMRVASKAILRDLWRAAKAVHEDPAGRTPVAGGVAPTTAPVARGWAAGPSPGSVAPESP